MNTVKRALWAAPAQWDAGVDFLTCYWSTADSGRFPAAQLREVINGEIAAGFYTRARFQRGVEWWGAGAASVGKRGEERYYRAHGDCARRTFAICEAAGARYSRIDCQATIEYETPQGSKAREAYEEWGASPKRRAGPRTAKLIQDSKGGQTFYLGSRKSDVMLRLYDHSVAHGSGAAGCRWRFEVEYKGSRAVRAGSLVASAAAPDSACASLVVTAFTDRGVECPLLVPDLRTVMESRPIPDIYRRMAWLQKQVRPAVVQLCGDGYVEAVVQALGLDSFVQLKPREVPHGRW